jgi:hypothetical protein
MPGDKELQTKLTMQDEATDKLNKFHKHVNTFAQDINKALKPISQYRSMFNKLSIVGVLTFGAMAKAAKETSAEVKYLDEMAVRLHTTLGALANKKYGNTVLAQTMAGNNVSIGRGQLAAVGEQISKVWHALGAGTLNALGGITKDNRARGILEELKSFQVKRLGRNTTSAEDEQLWQHANKMASMQLGGESKQRTGRSQEGMAASAEVLGRTDQYNLSSVGLQKKRFDEEVELYRIKGVEEMDLAKLRTSFENNLDRDRNIQFMKMQAEQLKAKGETYAAMDVDDQIALEEFKKRWGEDGEMVDAFKRGLGEIRAQKSIFVTTMRDVAGALTDSLATNMTSMKGFLQDFGNSAMSILKQVAAQYAVSSTLGQIWSPFNVSGLEFHDGGVIRAHSGLAVDEVPIIAQTGERVLSRKQNREYESGMRGGGQTVIIQQPIILKAWDLADIQKNTTQIEAIFAGAMRRQSRMVTEAMKRNG